MFLFLPLGKSIQGRISAYGDMPYKKIFSPYMRLEWTYIIRTLQRLQTSPLFLSSSL